MGPPPRPELSTEVRVRLQVAAPGVDRCLRRLSTGAGLV